MNNLVGLYIHIPFCRKKCRYCSFFSVVTSEHIPEYLSALRREMETLSTIFPKVDTVYMGGGTPSFLGVSNINTILNDVCKFFSLADNCEVTIESNPDDITEEMAGFFSSSLITRVIIGVQSFNNEKLKLLGRNYNSNRVIHALDILMNEDAFDLGVDLIYGTIFDSIESWKRELEILTTFLPVHISCYELTIAPKRTLYSTHKYEVKKDDETVSETYLFTSHYLQSKGYIHYEVSNFALGEEHISKHNWKYWKRRPYIGLGPSAHSFYEDVRWWNVASLKKYINLLKANVLPVAGREILTKKQIDLEVLALGMRVFDGLRTSDLTSSEISVARLRYLEELGYVKASGEKIFPTTLGYLISDSLPIELCEMG